MPKSAPLPVDKLRAACPPESVPYATSQDIPSVDPSASRFQPRAISALELGLALTGREYNIYLAGDPYMGRTHFLKSFLAPIAAKAPTPPDIVYVHNFDDQDRPRALLLPAGKGRALKAGLAKAVAAIREDIPSRFEQEAHLSKRQSLARDFQANREDLFAEMEERAAEEGFNLEVDEHGGLTLYPLLEGKVVSDEDFERMDPETRKALKAQGDEVLGNLGSYLRRLTSDDRSYRDSEKKIDRDTAAEVADWRLKDLQEEFAAHTEVLEFFQAVRQDVLEHYDAFLAKEPPALPTPQAAEQGLTADALAERYEVNLFVDNSKAEGAPIVIEDHPNHPNLLGSAERESDFGALYTDHTLIKAGSLHKALGGFLILRIDDLAHGGQAWEGLLRALRSGLCRIEDPSDGDAVRTRTIEPQPVPLTAKVILVGTDETYELLLYGDERFQKLFKLKAHMQDHIPRTPENETALLGLAGAMIAKAGLKPFTREALAGLVEYASSLTDDQERLSLRLPLLRELMCEASALAGLRGADMVDGALLRQAREARLFRANLLEEDFLAEYDREIIKVATDGQAVGRANGLSVRMVGDLPFGLPHQIACTVGVGHGGILDLEREAELGGPIHTKGMMILKSYLVSQFAQDKPVVLTGSLCFEQSYAEVEGDSASGAELAALLSALSGVPISLSKAFTGAVGSSGAIMAVGGLNQKIEGFFEVCRRRGLTGRQGVLLPRDNVVNLMLKEEVLQAVRDGLFNVWPVASIEEAMELLTGMEAGSRGPDGLYPQGTLFRLVDERLARLAQLAVKWGGFSRPLNLEP
ncbi:Lon protease [Fundidesulfovibrio magnetotacticus]|uniref:endopeptidase La n=1 Tax=Fundidesulfovibrio magnetotacticus TaxID=2730080 RepID=A0A6V8LPZ1_9BACT|nr:ATP-binding protein [Fundidesulfovibrio magnetotacticus]GFK94622.1 Lon protease [Fundidesulfovibrio magnetotacticus]